MFQEQQRSCPIPQTSFGPQSSSTTCAQVKGATAPCPAKGVSAPVRDATGTHSADAPPVTMSDDPWTRLGQSLKRWSAPLDPITSPGPRVWLAMGKGGVPPRHIPAVARSWRTNLTFCTTPALWMQSPSLLREGHKAPQRYCFYSVPILTNAVVHTRR